MTVEEIEKLLRLAKELGCQRLSVSGFEAAWFESSQSLQEHRVFIPKAKPEVIQELADALAAGNLDSLDLGLSPSEEDLKSWHIPGPLPSEVKQYEQEHYKQLEEALPNKAKPH